MTWFKKTPRFFLETLSTFENQILYTIPLAHFYVHTYAHTSVERFCPALQGKIILFFDATS